MNKLIFLSHIHEETHLAQIIQSAIEDEFSGFVDVFVSSDGKTIPAGANFLKRIEDGLLNCIGAIYLISPISVKRNWINFELGAVWIRSSFSVMNSGPEIPAIPICHSNLLPSQLPMPLSSLNGIVGNNSAQLEFAFKSIQNAVGGKGRLKTDFEALSIQVKEFERVYMIGDNLVQLFLAIGSTNIQIDEVITMCKTMQKGEILPISLGRRDNELIGILKSLESNGLKGYLELEVKESGISFGLNGASLGGDLKVKIASDLINEFAQLLKNTIK